MPSTTDTTAIRNITPIVTPSSVKKLFSFWTRICSSAIRSASKIGTRLSGCRPGIAAAITAARIAIRIPVVAGDETVAQHDDAPGVGRDLRLVGDHDDGLPLFRKLAEDPHDLLRRPRVEVSRGFVSQQDRRPVDKRARDRHALALAAG